MQPPRVDAPAGVISGLRQGETAVFRGIPYAQPPIGPLRWRGPQRVPFAEVTTVPEPSIPGDDILNLNVLGPGGQQPATPAGARLDPPAAGATSAASTTPSTASGRYDDVVDAPDPRSTY